jgi:fused signal recognition particle receptor
LGKNKQVGKNVVGDMIQNSVVIKNTTNDEDVYEELEEILVQADVGVATAMELVENVRRIVKERRIEDAAGIKPVLKEQIRELLGTGNMTINVYWQSPTVVLVVGVNGVGKTTTIGKMAHLYKMDGKRDQLKPLFLRHRP